MWRVHHPRRAGGSRVEVPILGRQEEAGAVWRAWHPGQAVGGHVEGLICKAD